MVKDEFSTFNRHSAWFSQRGSQTLHETRAGELEHLWRRRAPSSWHRNLPKWECAGPFNVAGRVTSLIAHPADPRRLWAGAAAGGVWTTDDSGASWKSCWPHWASPNIGALAFDLADPNLIYCATGEANISPDCYPGSGLYLSRDTGVTWELLAEADTHVLPRRIGVLLPCRHSHRMLYLGGVTLDEQIPAGLYGSADGGKNWLRENAPSSRNYWCHSLAAHPEGFLLAGLELGGAQTGIWRSGDRGAWKQLHRGLPAGDKTGRISLAIARSLPDTVYALVANRLGSQVLGVYRSRNGGERWEEVSGTHFAAEGQSSYNNTIAVHPDDPDTVVCGLNDIHISRDGGATWRRASRWDAPVGSAKYVHSDQHAIVLPGGNLIYAANDGGVAVSEDLGQTWSMRVRGLVNTMFYDIDVAPRNGKIFGGGAQDNGSLVAGVTATEGDFVKVMGGDGAWMVFHPEDENHVYASRSDIHIFRHTAARHWSEEFWEEISPKAMHPDEHHQNAIAVVAIDPARPRTLWVGSRRLWRSTQGGRDWQPVSPVLDGTAITAIEIPSAAQGQVWAGTRRGGIFRSLDDGETWSGDLSGPEIPARVITRIETHPRTASRLVVTIGGTGMVSRAIPRKRAHTAAAAASALENIAHVFLSEDGGLVWRAIDTPEMPDVAYHAAVFETHEPYRLFVANDGGVWMTEDFDSWIDISTTLPNAIVSDLVYHHRDRSLTVATYGRGIWRVFL
jgi:photosystem II stability/assembly factor-like uncharacterized protein